MQCFSLLQADSEGKVPGHTRKAVDNVLWGFLHVGKKGSAVSKQQLDDEFLDSFCACKETPKAEHTAICSKTDADAIWQVFFCLTEQDAADDGEQGWGQDAPLLDASGDGAAA